MYDNMAYLEKVGERMDERHSFFPLNDHNKIPELAARGLRYDVQFSIQLFSVNVK